ALTGPEFDWWFQENQAGSLMSVARANGRVVGVAAHSLFQMVLGGNPALASFSVHATTAEEARGQGIFEALERRHEEEATERGVEAFAAAGSYAVLGHKEHRGTRLAYVADLAGDPRLVLRACLSHVDRDARALLAIPSPQHRATYASMGFLPTRTSLRLMGKAL